MTDSTSRTSTPSVAALAAAKRLPAEFLRDLGLRDTARGVTIPYRDAAGNELFARERLTLTGKNETRQPKGVPLAAYGSEQIERANKTNMLFVVEGESDCWTLWYHDLPALGIPGANAAKVILPEYVEAVEAIYVVVEQRPDGAPDSGGEQFRTGVPDRLAALGYKGKVYELRMPAPLKDVSDLHCADPDKFLMALQRAVAAAKPIPLAPARPEPPRAKRPVILATPYVAFPVDALPEPVHSFVIQGAAAMGCDTSYLALPALSVTASLIGNSRTIRLKRDWHEPAVLWTAIIGDSGTLKSPAVAAVAAPLYRLQKQLIKKFNDDLKEYEREKEQYDERKKKAKQNDKPFDEEPPDVPALPRVVTGDITIERLAELLESNPKGLLTCRDELGSWLNSFTRYKGRAGGSDAPNWLEMHRAGTVQVDRKTGDRRTLFINHAAVSITGGIQPGALARALTPEYMDIGLAARLLLAMPPKLPKRWTETEIHPDVQDAYEKLLYNLRELAMDKGKDGEREPFAVRLTPEAKKVWVAFYDEWAKEQANAEGELAAALSKLEGCAARLALLHHVISRVEGLEDCQPVEPASMLAGITLVKWFASEARRIYGMLGESEDDRDTRRLVEFIASRGGRITARQLQKSNGRKYQTVEDAEAALNALVDAGAAEWQEGEAPPHGGHRPRWLVLRPTPDTSDTRLSDEHAGGAPPSDNHTDTRTNPGEFPEKHERVSEVSGVGQKRTNSEGEKLRRERESGANGESRADPENGGAWCAPGHEGLTTPFDDEK